MTALIDVMWGLLAFNGLLVLALIITGPEDIP